MRRWLLFMLLLHGSFACGRADQFVPWPSLDPNTKSLLLFADYRGRSEVHAQAAEDLTKLELDPKELLHVTLLEFPDPLEAYELSPGLNALVEPTECAAWSPPTPLQGQVLDVASGSEAFTPLVGVPLNLDRIALARPCPCVDFEVEHVLLGPHGDALGLERFSNGAWALLTPVEVLLIDPDFTLTATIAKPETSPSFRAMQRLADDRLRIASSDGWMFELAPGRRTLVPIAKADTEFVIELAIAADGSEAIMPDDEGRVFYFDGSSFEEVPGSIANTGTNQHGTAAWLGPGHFVFSRRLGQGFFERTGPGALIESRPWDSTLKPISRLRYMDGFGLLLPTKTNSLHIRRTGRTEFEELGSGDSRVFVDGIRSGVPFDTGFMIGGANRLRQWHPRSGHCLPIGPGPNFTVSFDYLVGVDDSMIVGTGIGRGESQLFVFRR